MSALWRQNKRLQRCHSCSQPLELNQRKRKQTRCISCAKRAAIRQALRRAAAKAKKEKIPGG